MDAKALEHMFNEFAERKLDAAVALIAGGAKDYGEYKHACGVYEGLTRAQIEVQDLAKAYKESDEN